MPESLSQFCRRGQEPGCSNLAGRATIYRRTLKRRKVNAILHISKQLLSPLFVAVLIFSGYVAAQRSPSQASEQTQRAKPTEQTRPQEKNDLRDEVTQLQMQVKDLQAAVDDLKSQLKTIGVTAKENHDLVLDT